MGAKCCKKNPEKMNTKDAGSSYSPFVGMIFIFNLIVGTGTLALPKAFKVAGWVLRAKTLYPLRKPVFMGLRLVLLAFIGFTAFLTATFIVEVMACANALERWHEKKIEEEKSPPEEGEENEEPESEEKPLIKKGDEEKPGEYEITKKMDMAAMATMFYSKAGLVFFYICILLYLYGDLAIYGAAVPKSLRDVVCNYDPNSKKNKTEKEKKSESLHEGQPCFKEHIHGLTRFQLYQIFLAAFIVIMLPFAFFNLQKTTWLQILTSILRWLAFIIMITLASIRLKTGPISDPPPKLFYPSKVPNLFGASVYAFMCHHSIPGMVTPIRNKAKMNVIFLADFTVILVFYSLLSLTGAFAFTELEDLYTLNYAPNNPKAAKVPFVWIWILYFVAIFPVFTISANFPIITITLRDNIKTLFRCEEYERPVDPSKAKKTDKPKIKKPPREYHWAVDRIVFPLVTVLPPMIPIFFTNNVGLLVGITGSYAGAPIQYLIPALLVRNARTDLKLTVGPEVKNPYRSPFHHIGWVWFVSFILAFNFTIFLISRLPFRFGLNSVRISSAS